MRRHADMQDMDLEDHPLLHFPDLVLALLRAGGNGPATVADAARRLHETRAQARERAPVDPQDLARHLDKAREHLLAARLIDAEGGGFRTTARGLAILRSHPEGIDDGVLMQFPEFRAWIERAAAHSTPEDPLAEEFQDGWTAALQGDELDQNPHASETAQHAAWEDGWLEAERQHSDQE